MLLPILYDILVTVPEFMSARNMEVTLSVLRSRLGGVLTRGGSLRHFAPFCCQFLSRWRPFAVNPLPKRGL